MLKEMQAIVRTPVPFPLAVQVSYHEVCIFISASIGTKSLAIRCANYLFSSCGMAVDLLQGCLVHEADLVGRDSHDWAILAMEV